MINFRINRLESQDTDDRVLNSEFGIRKEKKDRRQSFEFGIGNAEFGMKGDAGRLDTRLKGHCSFAEP